MSERASPDPGWPGLLFWYGRAASAGERVTLDAETSHHLASVVRKRRDAEVYLADGAGGWIVGRIASSDRQAIEVAVERVMPAPTEPRRAVHLGFPILRSGRTETLLEKCVELGVGRFTPILSARTQHRPERPDRWARVIRSAAMQSLRSRPPELDAPASLGDWVAGLGETGLRWMARPGGRPPDAVAAAGAEPSPWADPAALVVGPEGDFTGEEWSLLEDAGFEAVSLGPTRLRAETAAIALVAALGLTMVPGG